MSEASNSSEITVTDTLMTIDLNLSPLTPSGESHSSIPMVILNANAKDHEESAVKENGIDTMNHQLFSAVQQMANNFRPPENVTMVKVQSKLVLIGIICLLILLFLIPITLYYTDQPPPVHIFNIPGQDVKTCSGNIQMRPTTEELLMKCGITNLTEDCINSSAITSLHTVYALGSVIEQSCTEDALPFFCNATIFLCSDSESHDLTSMCLNVRDRDCALEWRLVETFLNTSVPDCTSFEMNANLTFTKSPLPSCPDHFDIFCDSICLPVCGEYSSYRTGGTVFVSIWGTVGVIGGIVALIVCYFNRHKLFLFPQIYTVYNIVLNAVYLLLLVIPNTMRLFGDSRLLCSDHNLIVNLYEPTTFCQIQGYLFHFGFLCFLGFWCFHLFHLFHGLAFPYQAKYWMDSRKIRRRIHITEVFIVLVCGSLPPTVTIIVSDYHYDGVLCSPQSSYVLFYGEALPYIVTFLVGLIFLFSCLWILRNKRHLRPDNSEVTKIACLYCTTAEMKLFLLFFYYGVTMLFIIFRIVTYSQNMGDYNMYSNEYILCSAGGYKEECEVYREKAEASLNVTFVLSVFVGLLIAFMNLSHLMYVVNIRKLIRDTKKFMVTCCR